MFIVRKPATAGALTLHLAAAEWLTAAVVTGAQLPGCDPVRPAVRRHVRCRLCRDDRYPSTMVQYLFAQIHRIDTPSVPLPEMLDWNSELPGAA